ncbi:tetratricopeptide repeat protein [Streptomyces sp. SID9727]|uniref:tetratricopeptide repeat protein n=1 Tax=Streptomyces sp. SID9727 TaxID=2706114 RepID=UPI0013C7B025|nr:tetratricopeptide repeat protein [Streptomyces sp. SID9727]NEC69050.1 tetratricopeptide repeat protein [Streptomyces sp. SID9727]
MKFFRSRVRRTKQSPVFRVAELYHSGQYAEAEKAARAVVRSSRSGEELVVARTVAALSAGAQGRHTEAVSEYEEAFAVSQEFYGAEHWQTLKLRSDRAQQLAAAGRYAESQAECEAVVRAAAGTTDEDMRLVTAAATNGLVYALNAQGEHVRAEALARDALAEPGETHPVRVTLQLGLARSLNGQARHEEALAEAERAEELRRALPEKHRLPQAGVVHVIAATALLELGRVTEARARAGAGHAACLASHGPEHHSTVEARELLARFDLA